MKSGLKFLYIIILITLIISWIGLEMSQKGAPARVEDGSERRSVEDASNARSQNQDLVSVLEQELAEYESYERELESFPVESDLNLVIEDE